MLKRIEGEPVNVVPFHDPSYLSLYERKFLDDGVAILQEARVPEALREVAEYLRLNYPDVRIEDKPSVVYTHGVVSIRMTWNSQEEVVQGFRKENYDQVTIAARLASREVVISVRNGWQVLAESDWRITDRLISAMVNGVNNPLKWGKVIGAVQ